MGQIVEIVRPLRETPSWAASPAAVCRKYVKKSYSPGLDKNGDRLVAFKTGVEDGIAAYGISVYNGKLDSSAVSKQSLVKLSVKMLSHI